jgi:hypothetical protein
VAALAKRCVIDGLGVVLAGSTTQGSTILRDQVRRSDGATEATVLAPEVFRASAGAAGLLNGASGHAMDWDDTQLSTTADGSSGCSRTRRSRLGAVDVGGRCRDPLDPVRVEHRERGRNANAFNDLTEAASCSISTTR